MVLSTPYTAALVVTAALTAGLAGTAWRHRETVGATTLAALMAGVALWSGTAAFALASPDRAATLLLVRLQYVGIAVVPVAWAAFAAEYTGRERWLSRRRLVGVALLPAVTVALVWTNGRHGLIWAEAEVIASGPLHPLATVHGPWFWVFVAYAYGLLAAGTVLLGRLLFSGSVYRDQVAVLLLAAAAPWAGNAAYLLGLTPVGTDPTPIAFGISGLAISVAVFRARLLEVVPAAREIARQEVIEDMADGVIVLNADGRVVDANPAARRVLDAPDEGFVGTPIDAVDRRLADLIQDDPADGRTSIAIETGGRRRYYDVQISPLHRGADVLVGRLVVLRDVTDRARREQTLEALNETTRDLIEASDTASICEIAVEAARDVLGMSVSGIHLLDDEGGALRPVATTTGVGDVLGEDPTYTDEDSLVWDVYRSGEMRVIDDVGSVRDDLPNPRTPVRSGMVLPLGDHGVFIASSTERHRFDDADVYFARLLAAATEAALDRADRERRLEARTRELERQNERLEEFASVVSHDLRNPLNVARGHLEMFRESGDEDRLDAIEQAHDRMETIIEDVLSLARRGRTVSETTAVELRTVAADAWKTVETARADLEIEGDLTLEADDARLRELLENLFRNAIEHGGEGVTVRTGPLGDAGTAESGDTRSSGAHGGFYVEDDGIGIPEEERDRVFETGFTTTDGGTGFGLNIVEEIARAHGWTITATEGADGGARFEITPAVGRTGAPKTSRND